MEKRAECPKCGKQNAQWKQLDHASSCCLVCGSVMFHNPSKYKKQSFTPFTRQSRGNTATPAVKRFPDLCLWPFKGFVSAIYHVA